MLETDFYINPIGYKVIFAKMTLPVIVVVKLVVIVEVAVVVSV